MIGNSRIIGRVIPKEIGDLINLSRLDVSGNQLIMVSRNVSRLINLRYLNFADNKLESFPYFLGQLPSLEIIICERNPYKDATKEFIAQSSNVLIKELRKYVFEHQDLLNEEVWNGMQLPSEESQGVKSITSENKRSYVKGSTHTNYQHKKTSLKEESESIPDPDVNRFNILLVRIIGYLT